MSRTLLLALLALSSAPTLARAQKREVIIPPGTTPSPILTPAIRVGNLVYASGQLGTRPNPDTTIQGQTGQALENTKRVFEAAGTNMAHALKCTVFLVDVKDFAGMNQAYREFFPDAPPARTTVVVAALVVPNAKIEVECLAAMPER